MLSTPIPLSEMTRDLPARASQWQARLIAPHAGLALLGEFAVGLGFLDSVEKYLPKPESGAGHKPSEFIFPLILMLNGGGRSLEDPREIKRDEGLR